MRALEIGNWDLEDGNASERSGEESTKIILLAESEWKVGTKEGNSPVSENSLMLPVINLEYGEERTPCRKQARLFAKAKYSISPIVN